MLNFDVETRTEGTSALVAVRGDLDLQVAARVAEELTGAEADRPDLLVLDLSGLSFMDSSGMGVVAAAHARAVDAGRRFVVVRPPFSVRRAFELSNFNEVLTIVEDVESVFP
ncbi:MAG TPA: STAS domain-containing protein [Thermoleophilaceae bacterium]|jgi:stage II sporulation protein AA (anti-sigma F factor antagonist)|nr:STAS domain-containing protein [Thermoleophilaceae bacterium]